MSLFLFDDVGLHARSGRIDIDFEYPSDSQAAAFALLLAELKTGLAAHAASKGDN